MLSQSSSDKKVDYLIDGIFRKSLTASVTCLRMDSLMGFCVFFVSLSKQVDISSMQIHTSASVMKHPKHCTMYGQSCDFNTTSKSIVILLVSSSLPVRRICCKCAGESYKNLRQDCGLEITNLHSDNRAARLVFHFNYMAARPVAQLTDVLQLVDVCVVGDPINSEPRLQWSKFLFRLHILRALLERWNWEGGRRPSSTIRR